MENRNASAIVGSAHAPYINALARQGALFTNSHAVSHPSQPNYLALFSGSTQGTASDACPQSFAGPNLGRELINAGDSFVGYAEGLPSAGFAGCHSGSYARKHAPWIDFTNVPASDSRPYRQFRIGAALPTVSFVIPNICHDMHNCPIATGDRWLSEHIGPYVRWAHHHRSLLILTWDEAHGSATNHIVTIFAGPMVKPAQYARRITHYTVLCTIEDMFGLPHAGRSQQATPITGVWQGSRSG
jgi:acid phosphatase